MASISVILPTHNRADLLPRAVNSVLLQKEVNFELVMVDDGSSDNSTEVLQNWQNHPQVKIIRQENLGVSSARNRGVAESTGETLAFIDSDDEWKPGKLVAQLKALEATGVPIVQTEETWIRKGVRVNPPEYLKKVSGDIFLPSLARCMITPSSVMLQRSLFEECGGFDESLPACEDYDLWLRVSCAHHVGLVRESYLTRYAGHGDQLSEKYPAMDKFRIYSLEKRIKEGCFSFSQNQHAINMLQKKLSIYRQGCEKRGKQSEVNWCQGIADFLAQKRTEYPAPLA